LLVRRGFIARNAIRAFHSRVPFAASIILRVANDSLEGAGGISQRPPPQTRIDHAKIWVPTEVAVFAGFNSSDAIPSR
jgi:hypothetical protein